MWLPIVLVEIRKMHIRQTRSGINFHHCSYEKKSLWCQISLKRNRYHDGVNGSRIWNHPWAIDWHHDLWPLMTLNCPSSRSSKLHVKYSKIGDRYDDGVNRNRIGSHPCAVDWHHNIWHWTVLDLGHRSFTSNISIAVRGTMLDTMEVI